MAQSVIMRVIMPSAINKAGYIKIQTAWINLTSLIKTDKHLIFCLFW